MFELKHTDDGKEKWQSHEYQLDVSNDLPSDACPFRIVAYAYGSSKAFAGHEMLDTVKAMQEELVKVLDQLTAEISKAEADALSSKKERTFGI